MEKEPTIKTREDAFAYFNTIANLAKETPINGKPNLIEDFRNDPDYQVAKLLIGQGRRLRHNYLLTALPVQNPFDPEATKTHPAFRITPIISREDETAAVLTKAVISRGRQGGSRGAYFRFTSTADGIGVDAATKAEATDFNTRYQRQGSSITISVPDTADGKRIAGRIQDLDQSLKGLAASSDQAIAKLREIQEKDEALDDPLYDVAAIVLHAGLVLYGVDITEKLASLLIKKSSNKHAAEKLRLTSIIYRGAVFLKRDGISLLELMDVPNLIKKNGSAQIFNYMMNNSFHTADDEADLLVAGEEFPICRDYPNLTRENLSLASYLIRQVPSLHPDLLEPVIQQSSGDAREIAIRGKRLAESIVALRDIFCQKVFLPEDKEFPIFRQIILQKFKKSSSDALKMLFIAGVASDVNKAGESYREARRLMDRDPEFYSAVAENLLVYNSLLPDEMRLASSDDVSLIFDTEVQVSSVPKVELNELGKIIGAIFAKSAVNEARINPQLINWGKLVAPQSVYIEFEGRPKKFYVSLGYESARDGILGVDLIFDLYKNAYNWSFIEDPAELPELSIAVMDVVKQILIEILREASKPKTQEVKPEVTISAPAKSRGEKVRPERGLPSRKVTPRKILSPIERALLEKVDDEEAEIIRKIEIPENLQDICRRLSNFDQSIVAEGIAEFNEREVGRFKMLKAKGEEGQSLYTLRINTRVPGGVRVLLEEGEPLNNGIRNFKILDIDYRRNIYRKLGI